MIDLASDSEESANAFGVTFQRSASDELNSFVDDFSTKAGFTTAELQELLSFTGGVVNGMGASVLMPQLSSQNKLQNYLEILDLLRTKIQNKFFVQSLLL